MSKCTEKAQESSFRGPEAVLAEFMLILGIHFHFEERDELESLIRTQLSISDFQIKSMTISRLKQVFDQDLYSTETLTKLAISVPATPKLSGKEMNLKDHFKVEVWYKAINFDPLFLKSVWSYIKSPL